VKPIDFNELTDRLIADLRTDYPGHAVAGTASAQALRARFAVFGTEACRSVR
jgi:hypothetical protein